MDCCMFRKLISKLIWDARYTNQRSLTGLIVRSRSFEWNRDYAMCFRFNYDSIRIRRLVQGWRETEMSMKPEASLENFLVITPLIHPHHASPCNSSASIFSLLLACGRDRSRKKKLAVFIFVYFWTRIWKKKSCEPFGLFFLFKSRLSLLRSENSFQYCIKCSRVLRLCRALIAEFKSIIVMTRTVELRQV